MASKAKQWNQNMTNITNIADARRARISSRKIIPFFSNDQIRAEMGKIHRAREWDKRYPFLRSAYVDGKITASQARHFMVLGELKAFNDEFGHPWKGGPR